MVCPRYPYLRARLSVLNSFILGVLVMLFFQCMASLLDPANRKREGIKWGLVSYTVVMFLCATVVIGTANNIASISFIDNHDFPGVKGVLYPGLVGYQEVVYFKAINVIPNATFPLNNWLANGLLVSSCYCAQFHTHFSPLLFSLWTVFI